MTIMLSTAVTSLASTCGQGFLLELHTSVYKSSSKEHRMAGALASLLLNHLAKVNQLRVKDMPLEVSFLGPPQLGRVANCAKVNVTGL